MDSSSLNTEWILWYHSINDNNWDKNSYKELISIKNLYDYKFLSEEITNEHLKNTMFFIMRKNIFPTWEDPDNRNGYCISYRINSSNILKCWNDIFLECITENIHLNLSDYNELTGISITPKKEFNILKLWFRDNTKHNLIKSYEPYIIKSNCMIKKHDI